MKFKGHFGVGGAIAAARPVQEGMIADKVRKQNNLSLIHGAHQDVQGPLSVFCGERCDTADNVAAFNVIDNFTSVLRNGTREDLAAPVWRDVTSCVSAEDRGFYHVLKLRSRRLQ